MSIEDIIKNKIKDAYFLFQDHEKEIVKIVKRMGCKYIEDRERPIAAFIMEKISMIESINAISELPLRGLGEDKVKEFKKKVLDQVMSTKKIGEITKRYTRYEIDGAAFESNSNNFIEFKISDSPAKAKIIDFVQDYLKYRIYTSSNTSKGIPTNFFYVNLFKNKNYNFPMSNPPSKPGDYSVSIDNWNKIDWVKVRHRNIIIINSRGLEAKPLEYLSECLITLSIQKVMHSELKDSYDKKIGDLKKDLENAAKGEEIYGRNVVFSKKMTRNFKSLVAPLLNFAKKTDIVKAEDSISWDDLKDKIEIKEEELEVISNVYRYLNSKYFDKERKERPSTKSIIQKTNYLLAFIEISLKREECWNDDIEFDFVIPKKEKEGFIELYTELLRRCKRTINEFREKNAHILIIKHILFLYSSFFQLNEENVLESRDIFKNKKTIQKYNRITKNLFKNLDLNLNIDGESIGEIEDKTAKLILQSITKPNQK